MVSLYGRVVNNEPANERPSTYFLRISVLCKSFNRELCNTCVSAENSISTFRLKRRIRTQTMRTTLDSFGRITVIRPTELTRLGQANCFPCVQLIQLNVHCCSLSTLTPIVAAAGGFLANADYIVPYTLDRCDNVSSVTDCLNCCVF